MQKLALIYNRFSRKGQSQHSIERQDTVNNEWAYRNQVSIMATFNDRGHSAKNFDRPDVKKLFAFIQKQGKKISYLIVHDLSRFSRDAGPAITMVCDIQKTFSINIVSASMGNIYDVSEPMSFQMMAMEFTQATVENIKRSNDVRGGIYAAKTYGRYVCAKPPFGFRKMVEDPNAVTPRKILIHEPSEAETIRYIFSAYNSGVPYATILQNAKQMGFNRHSNGVLIRYLKNPIYIGFQDIKAYKKLPSARVRIDGLEPIVSPVIFAQVQAKLAAESMSYKRTADADFPLRGVLHCHCGKLLTAGHSKGRSAYYPYYKCQGSKHLNLAAGKAHTLLAELLQEISFPQHLAQAVREDCQQLIAAHEKEARLKNMQGRTRLSKVEELKKSVNRKFSEDQLSFEAYDQLHKELTAERIALRASIAASESGSSSVFSMLNKEIEALTNLNALYEAADLLSKQKLLNLVFDNSLYFSEGNYRTASVNQLFNLNLNKIKASKLLDTGIKNESSEELSLSWVTWIRTKTDRIKICSATVTP